MGHAVAGWVVRPWSARPHRNRSQRREARHHLGRQRGSRGRNHPPGVALTLMDSAFTPVTGRERQPDAERKRDSAKLKKGRSN